MTVIWIVGGIFLGLALLVPLIEKFGPRPSPKTASRLGRWVLPLAIIATIIHMIYYAVTH